MKFRPEHIVALTALALIFSGIGCQLVAWHWSIPVLRAISKWLFIGGFATAFLPLALLFIVLGWEKIKNFGRGNQNCR